MGKKVISYSPDIKTLRERLGALRGKGLSWREISREHYPGVSFATLADIYERGYEPKREATRRALGLPARVMIQAPPTAAGAYLSPSHRIIVCGYRRCRLRVIANAPNQRYCSPAHGRAERRLQAQAPPPPPPPAPDRGAVG